MSGVATAIAGAAVVGGVVSYMGAQEQASAAGQAADTLNLFLVYIDFVQQKVMRLVLFVLMK